MLSTFIPGLEDLVEDGAAPAPAQPETISTVDAEIEKAEAVQAASELGAMDAEGEKITNMTNVVSAKLDEMERMVAHIQKYGVDRSFLSLCNHDNILNQSFDLQLPSCESFDTVGDPNSIASQEALEGLKNGIRNAIEWIKKMWKKFVDWFMKKMKAIKDFFYGKIRERQMKAVEEAIRQFSDLSEEEIKKAMEEIRASEEAKAKTPSKPQKEPEVSIEELIKQRDELLHKFADAVQKDEKYIQTIIRRFLDVDNSAAGDSDPKLVKADIKKLNSLTEGSDSDDADLKRQYDQFIEVAKAVYADPDSLYDMEDFDGMGGLRYLVNKVGDINELDERKRFDDYARMLSVILDQINRYVNYLDRNKQNPNPNQATIATIRERIPRLQKQYVMYVDVITAVCKVSQTQRDNILKRVSKLCSYCNKNVDENDYARNEYERMKNKLGYKSYGSDKK